MNMMNCADALKHLIGFHIIDALDEIEVWAVTHHKTLKVVDAVELCIDGTNRLNVVIDREGKIAAFR